MTFNEREVKILDILDKNKIVSFKNLLAELEIPAATLRRDLTRMDKDKKLIRFHGGAKVYNENLNKEYYEEYNYPNLEAKRAIARQAISLVSIGDTIFLDSGTTALTMARLLEEKNITVYTNSLAAAFELSKKGIRVFIGGGFIQNNISAVFGDELLRQLKEPHFDKCFLATTSISNEKGFQTVYEEDSRVKRCVLERSDQRYIIADHHKFEDKAHITFASAKDVILITDNMPEASKSYISYIENRIEK